MSSGQRYESKVAVVTGGGSGIGLAIVRRLIAEGASVVAADINESALEAVAAEFGDRCVGIRADVAVEADNEAMVKRAVDAFGQLDVAFNVAGSNRLGSIVDLTEEEWDFTVDICLKGAWFGMKHEARQMIAQGTGGAIVSIASLNSVVPMHGGVAYCAAKAGVAMLTQMGALELGEYGIRANCISPGITDTPLARPLIDLKAVYERFIERIPLGTHGTPDDMAAAACFLGSDDARYVSGVNLYVDGAWSVSGYPDFRPWLDELTASIGPQGSTEP